MATIDVLPVGDLVRRAATVARPAGGAPELPAPLRATWYDAPVVLVDGTTPYLVAPAEHDPQRDARGRHVIPAREREVLRRHLAAGHRFDRVAVVHELDPRGPAAALVPTVMRRGPVTVSAAVARAVVGDVPDHPPTARTARALDALVGRGLSALGSALRSRPDLLLDPVVFGVVGIGGAPDDGAPALWYPLCGWMW